jgi:crossover junction endodeoxyribonuclease RuvC
VVEDAGGSVVRHVDHGVVAIVDAGPVEARLVALHAALARALDAHRPDVVAIEEVFHARNARSAIVLGQARGVALLAAAQAGVRVRSFAPAVIKQAVTGTGRAEKDQVGRMVCMLLGITVRDRADATDALAAAICGLLRGDDPTAVAGKQRFKSGTAASMRGAPPRALRGTR